jgi:hypothetical protein
MEFLILLEHIPQQTTIFLIVLLILGALVGKRVIGIVVIIRVVLVVLRVLFVPVLWDGSRGAHGGVGRPARVVGNGGTLSL